MIQLSFQPVKPEYVATGSVPIKQLRFLNLVVYFSVCEAIAVNKISGCQSGGPVFISRPGPRGEGGGTPYLT